MTSTDSQPRPPSPGSERIDEGEREHWLTRAMNLGFTFGRVAEMVQREATSRSGFGVAERLRLWRRGFLSPSVQLYGPDAPDTGEYLSDYARFVQTPLINDRFARMLDNKLAFQHMVEAVRPGMVPRLLGTILRGSVHPTDAGTDGGASGAEGIMERSSAFVAKPVEGTRGVGLLFVSRAPDGSWIVNRRPASRPQVVDELESCDAHIVVDFVHQAEYARTVNPDTTNTVRMVTMRMPDTGEVVVPAAVHRFGAPGSGLVDTWHQGGVVAAIDLDTGVLGKAVGYPPEGDVPRLSHHPRTGAAIEGVTIPGWERVVEEMRDLAARLPFVPYVGWDVVVTDGGFAVLEGNNRTGLDLVQVHVPILRDPRVRRFFEHYGVSLPESAPPA